MIIYLKNCIEWQSLVAHYVWCGIGEKSQSLIRWFPIFNSLWYFKDLITWKKLRGIGMRKGWLYTREELMWFVKDNKSFIWNTENQYHSDIKRHTSLKAQNGGEYKSEYKRITNVWDDVSELSGEAFSFSNSHRCNHFTVKPITYIKRIINAHTKPGDLVLDCFAGSGTTGIAASELDREFILIENDDFNFSVTENRLNEYNIKFNLSLI